MFIKKSFADEIAASMEAELTQGTINKYAETEIKLVKIAEHLNSVSEMFEELGLEKQAEIATLLLETLVAKKKKKKKVKKTKPKATKKPNSKKDDKKEELTSEKMVENLKEKGWMFNETNDADDGEEDCGDMNYALDGSNKPDKNCAMCGSDLSHAQDDDTDDLSGSNPELMAILEDLKSDSDDDFEDEYDAEFDDNSELNREF